MYLWRFYKLCCVFKLHHKCHLQALIYCRNQLYIFRFQECILIERGFRGFNIIQVPRLLSCGICVYWYLQLHQCLRVIYLVKIPATYNYQLSDARGSWMRKFEEITKLSIFIIPVRDIRIYLCSSIKCRLGVK